MPRYAQLVMGPAGAGKSTYCAAMQRQLAMARRTAHLFNLDPAAESFAYEVTWDIREMISVDDVAETLDFGPNGALVYCMEFLLENLDVFDEALGDFEDDYLIIDCPGQIELYTHMPLMRQLVHHLQEHDFRLVAVYLLDAQFVVDTAKFFSGILSCLSVMCQLEIPHLNVLSKVDLLGAGDRDELERFLDPDPDLLLGEVNANTTRKQQRLNHAMAVLIRDFSLVKFAPFVRDDEELLTDLMLMTDQRLQYGEDEEPQEPHELGDLNDAVEGLPTSMVD